VATTEPQTLSDHWINILSELTAIKVWLFRLETRKPELGELARLKRKVDAVNRYVETFHAAWQMERSHRAEGKVWK
jgi:hypothetical protein